MISCCLLVVFALLIKSCSVPEPSSPGENDDTLSWYKLQLNKERQSGNVTGEITALTGIAKYFRKHREIDSALYYFTKKSEVARDHKEWHELVSAMMSRARCYEKLGLYEEQGLALDSAIRTSRRSDDPTDVGYALQERGLYFYNRQEYDSSLNYFNMELVDERLRNDSMPLSACLSNLGMVHAAKGEYGSSVMRYMEAIGIADSLDLDSLAAVYSGNLGIVLKDGGEYKAALDYLLSAARYYDQDTMLKEQAACYSTVGNIYLAMDNLDEALRFQWLSYGLRQKIQYEAGIAMSLNNLGETYLRREQYDSALSYLHRSLVLKEKMGNKKLIASTLDLLGETAFRQRDYSSADRFYRQSLKLEKEIENAPGEASTLNKMARLYFGWNKRDSAERMLEQARTILSTVPAKRTLLENYRISADMMRSAGDATAALHFLELYIALKDTLLNEDKEEAVADALRRYESEKQDIRIQQLGERETARIEAFDQQQKFLYASILAIAFLIIALGLAFYLIRTNRKALAQKQAMMSELHHRVKNNLQVLADMLQLQQTRIGDPAMKEMVRAVERRVTAMIFVHRGLYGDDPGSLVNMRDYIPELLRNLAESFGYDYRKVSAGLHVDALQMKADDALNMGFICNELISNAFKYAFPSTPDPKLTLTLVRENTNVVLTVADNGPGIPDTMNGANPSTFGLRLVELFSRDLDATVKTDTNHPGVRVQLVLPFKDQNS